MPLMEKIVTELKENVAGTTQSEFEDLDYNDVDKALKSVGISLKDDVGQFRDLDDVFLDLSAKWNTLSRNQQRKILRWNAFNCWELLL